MKVAGLEEAIRLARIRLWEKRGGENPPSRSDTILAAVQAFVANGAAPRPIASGADVVMIPAHVRHKAAPSQDRVSRHPNKLRRGSVTEGEAMSIRNQYATMRPGGRLQRLAKQMRCSDTTIRRIIEGTYVTIKDKNLPSMIGKTT